MSDDDRMNETVPNFKKELHRPRHFNTRNAILNQLGDNKEFLTNPSLAELDRVIDNNGKLDEVQKNDVDKTVLKKVKFTSVKKEGIGWIRVKMVNHRLKNIGKYLNDQVDRDKMDQVAEKKFRKRIKHGRNFIKNDMDEEDEYDKNDDNQMFITKTEKKNLSYFPVFFSDELPTEISEYTHRVNKKNKVNKVKNNNFKNERNNNFNDDNNNYLNTENSTNYMNNENYGYYNNTENNETTNKGDKNKFVKKKKDKSDDESPKKKIKEVKEVKEIKEQKHESPDIRSNIIRKVKKKLISKSLKNDKNIDKEKEKNDNKEYKNEKNDEIIIKKKNKKIQENNVKSEIKENNFKKINHKSKEKKDNKENSLEYKKNGRKFIGSYKSKRIHNED